MLDEGRGNALPYAVNCAILAFHHCSLPDPVSMFPGAMRFRLKLLTLAVASALPAPALAMAEPGGIALRMQTTLAGVPGGRALSRAPVYFEADRMQGHGDRETEAQGNARARTQGRSFGADWMRFDSRYNELTALGNVHIEQAAYVMEGLKLRYELDTERGIMERAVFYLSPQAAGNVPIAGSGGRAIDARGSAERIFFEGPGVFRAEQAAFTTCAPGNDSWFIRSRDLQIYQERGVGVAREATVEFKDTPIFYAPYFSFPLQQERKSGFLAPRYGSTSASGVELAAPFYWAIAPNYDWLITPRAFSKRGVQVQNHFRYLQPGARGNLYYEALPDDRVSDRTRQALAWKHTQDLGWGWTGRVDINKVSDDKYFTDLSTRVAVTSLTNLTREASVSRSGSWGETGTYAAGALVQGWQTLQTDPLAPLTPPYSRRPQITFNARNPSLAGLDFDWQSSYVDFDHPTLTRGKRMVAYPSVSYPIQTSAYSIIPKIGVHATRYTLDNRTSPLTDHTRIAPIASVQGSATFERDANFFGNAYTQTLEPRAYYVYIPFRDQRQLPNFDSGQQDINFATIFTENQFSGNDRINDANQLTLGATSRLISPANGFEVIRGALAQRFYFRPQEVTLPGVPVRNNQSSRSDLLAALGGSITRDFSTDLGWQYNTDTRQTQRTSISTRYHPQPGKLVNVSYRQSVASSFRQFDTSFQWPVAQGWNAVGRWNYSVQEKRMLEGLAGMEYDGGCFVFRVVAHRLSTTTTASNSSVFFELQLNGVARAGSNTLDLLKRNVGGYSRRDPYAGRGNEYAVPEE
jgi:LPS-assembly protein